jgi:hypothetical protein
MPERIPALCQMFVAFDHCRPRSTQTLCTVTSPSAPRYAASERSVYDQCSSSLPWPPSVIPSSYIGSLARISTWAWAHVVPSSTKALNVIQPANMCPCGVISVNDSSSA